MKRAWLGILVVTALSAAYFYFGTRGVLLLTESLKITVSDAKTVTEILSAVVQTVAIVIAGYWTYERFIKAREDYPYPEIQHRAYSCNLGNGYDYLSVFISVTNKGKTKLDLSGGKICVRQVLPLSGEIDEAMKRADLSSLMKGKNISDDPDKKLFFDQSQRVGWRTLGERTWKDNLRKNMHELEPGQTREIQFDFLFNDAVKVVEILSYFEFKKTGRWEYVSFHAVEK